MPIQVVTLTAGMGAGHDQVAVELRRRLRERGVEVEVIDVWDLLPLRVGRLITGFYKAMVWHLPWLYELIYWFFFRPSTRSKRVSPIVMLAARGLSRWIDEHRPVMAVSTFHVCSQMLGAMRRTGRMPIETASIVVDFAAHGLWVDPDVDTHFCLHDAQARRIEDMGAKQTVVTGPVVKPVFQKRRLSLADARSELGLSEDDQVILIVAGSWGAGHVERTVQTVAAAGRFRPIVVAGDNDKLRCRLSALGCAQVFGWVEEMDRLMAAADVVVENAGGLMAMEAMAVGTPVVSFEPIPGHGRENVARMAEVGVSLYARSDRELVEMLDRLMTDEPYRRRLTSTAAAIFKSDLAAHVAARVATAYHHEGRSPLTERPASA
jgi:UDP-N-acetylglucosamine:LPS N-acetylglucosamine transferase